MNIKVSKWLLLGDKWCDQDRVYKGFLRYWNVLFIDECFFYYQFLEINKTYILFIFL